MSVIGEVVNTQMTALVSVTKAGHLLPCQLIYPDKCVPRYGFPSDWNVTTSGTRTDHCSSEATMLQFLEKIIDPYVTSVRAKLGSERPALCIFDTYAAHMRASVEHKLTELGIHFVHIPPGLSHELQPIELTVCGCFKSKMEEQFKEWNEDDTAASVVGLPEMRLLHAAWVVQAYQDSSEQINMIKEGFSKAGLLSSKAQPSSVKAELPSTEAEPACSEEGRNSSNDADTDEGNDSDSNTSADLDNRLSLLASTCLQAGDD